MQLADILLRAAQGSIRTAAEHPQCSDFSPITSTPHGGLADHITALSFDKNKHLGKCVWCIDLTAYSNYTQSGADLFHLV